MVTIVRGGLVHAFMNLCDLHVELVGSFSIVSSVIMAGTACIPSLDYFESIATMICKWHTRSAARI